VPCAVSVVNSMALACHLWEGGSWLWFAIFSLAVCPTSSAAHSLGGCLLLCTLELAIGCVWLRLVGCMYVIGTGRLNIALPLLF
jgi:hypothetical protein